MATSLQRELLDIIDGQLNLSALFGGNIYSVSDIGNISKPNPAIFLYAAKMLKSEVQKCLVIEDSPNGIISAKQAGMYCVAITSTYSGSYLNNADLIVNEFSEINLNAFKA